MFANCESLISLDLSNLNTTKVNIMNSMFSNCYLLTSINLNNIDVSNVTNMGNMLNNCTSLKSIDLSRFFNSAKNVQYIDRFFAVAKA